MGDLNTFQERFLALRQSLLNDGVVRGSPLHINDLRMLSERIANEGTSFVKVTLPLLGKALDLGLVSGHFMCTAHFGLKRNTRLPLFAYALFKRIFTDEGDLRVNADASTIQFLRQFLLLDSKLIFEPSPVMREQAVQEFSDRMTSLRKLRLDTTNPVLRKASELIGYVLKDLSLDNIEPGHGPGSVAERIDRFGRWDFDSWPTKAERYYSYFTYGIHSLLAIVNRTKRLVWCRETLTRCCLVPKDFKGPRLISSEYSVNQYLQQGQMKAIMRHVSRHWLLRKSIRLEDQTFNQKAAKLAYGNDAVTLDLSSASDTVSVPLVWFLFREVPALRKRLMCTRSDYMLHAGKKIKIVAFAPMGSATCFPVETLVFWAISMASVMLTSRHGKLGNKFPSLSDVANEVRVFGDDIIVPRRALQPLVGTLQAVGCIVNKSKTCIDTPFRESCGSEWFDAADVTIIRNRQYQYGSSVLFDHPVLCDLQRKFFAKGYYNTAALLLEWAGKISPTPIISICHLLPETGGQQIGVDLKSYPHFLRSRILMRAWMDMDPSSREQLYLDRYSGCLGFQDSHTGNLQVRYHSAYQRYECRLPCLHQKTKEWVSEGYPRLLARLLGDQTDRIAIRDRKIKMAWSFLPTTNGFHHLELG